LAEAGPAATKPRLAVLDDNLYVRTQTGEVRPLSATFNRFVQAVAETGEFERVRYIVPVRRLREWEVEPALEAVDESLLEIVPTAWFSGISDYVLRAPLMYQRNAGPIDRAVADSDLLWLRLPASNALLALRAARRRGVAHFGWLAGSAAGVARGARRRAGIAAAAALMGEAYDRVTRMVGRSGRLIELDGEMFASVVTRSEIDASRATVDAPRRNGSARVAWAGRMAGEKGLVDLVDAVAAARRAGTDLKLVLIGDGPGRTALSHAVARLGADVVEDYGYVGDRTAFMELLRGCDLFVSASHSEGLPKTLVEAMAAGLPVIATDAGASRSVLANGERGVVVPVGDVPALGGAITSLIGDSRRRRQLSTAGLDWAASHTAAAQARRLIDRLRKEFPGLNWIA
jgi:glycosyltransferase involved in cell wall biosynthesis